MTTSQHRRHFLRRAAQLAVAAPLAARLSWVGAATPESPGASNDVPRDALYLLQRRAVTRAASAGASKRV